MPQDSQGRYSSDNEAMAVGSGSLASATKTTTGTSAAFDSSNLASLNATLAISAASGTSPTLDVTLETTADGTNYYTAGTFPQQTGVATVARVIGDLGLTSRWKWTVGGTTPSFTFTITATADREG